MTNDKKITTFKTYHVLILGCLLSALLVLNSKLVNNKKINLRLNKEKSQLFDEIVLGRKLQAQGQKTASDKVCDLGREELVEYYKTGDLEKIGLKEEPIKAEKETYIISLINIIKTMTSEPGDGEGEVEREEGDRLRNLQSFDINAIQDDLVIYIKHLLPILAFLVVAILAIPGWIICCFCCLSCHFY